MELTLNQQAISLAALMFVRGNASFESSLHDEEISALEVLKQAKAVVPGVVSSRDAVCAFCGLYRGPIFRSNEGLMVQCPDCGPFALDPASQRSWRLDDEWLIRKLRGALDISPHATVNQIIDGVWDIGRHKKRPVVLARRIDLVERHGLRIFHGPEPRSQSWVITPRPLVRAPLEPLTGTATWWQLEDRFALHGLALRLLDPDQGEKSDNVQDGLPSVAVHGPFSEDFTWVHLEGWPHGPIRLTEAQTRVFAALWEHRDRAQSSKFIMRAARLDSEKPMDVFKVKAANRDDPTYEGPRWAYNQLVVRQRRLGQYRLAWSS
ncbi:hypothetical protein [Limnohabitans lacus]|uniref:Uncharacterized protein n=1 Tax=Limnohabitans lacus TaxID=3045173 RepID=A0ABT6X9L8_9BURK|nr:hypothetical protein [Limnohabitans sp. HM2-2]MDI9234693.1 hypothetical protein [Limnohabitans sp. HM2-2]